MYKLRYYASNQRLMVKYFDTLEHAVLYSIYKTPYESMYGIDKVEV